MYLGSRIINTLDTASIWTSVVKGLPRRVVTNSLGATYAVVRIDADQSLRIVKWTDPESASIPTVYSGSGEHTPLTADVEQSMIGCDLGPDDILHIVYLTVEGGTKKLLHKQFDTSNDTWASGTTTVDTGGVATLNAFEPLDVWVDSDSTPHVVWWNHSATGPDVWTLNYSTYTSEAWAAADEVKASQSDAPDFNPRINVDGAGRILLLSDTGLGVWQGWENAGSWAATALDGVGPADITHTADNTRHILFSHDKRHTVVKSDLAGLTTTLGAFVFEHPDSDGGGLVNAVDYRILGIGIQPSGNDLRVVTATRGKVYQGSYQSGVWHQLREITNLSTDSGKRSVIAAQIARTETSDNHFSGLFKFGVSTDLDAWLFGSFDKDSPPRGGITHDVVIDGVGYMLGAPLVKADISQAVPRVSVSTETRSEENLSDLSSISQASWHHGRGDRDFDNPFAYLASDGLLTHIPNQITPQLGGSHTTDSTTLSAGYPIDAMLYQGNFYILIRATEGETDFASQSIRVWNNTNSEWDVVHTGIVPAAQFVAANSESLSAADSAALSTGNIDFTLACWVWLDSDASDMTIAQKGTASGDQREWFLEFEAAGNQFKFGVSSDGTSYDATVTAVTPVVAAGGWYFIHVTHNAASDFISIQVNNGDFYSVNYTNGVFDSTGDFTIGAADSAEFWDGRIAKFGFWKSLILGSDATSLYGEGNGRWHSELATESLDTGLIAYWDLDETSGNRADSEGASTLTDNNTVTSTTGHGSIVDPSADALDLEIHMSDLWVALGDNANALAYDFSASTWEDTGVPAYAFKSWDGKLWRADNINEIYFSADADTLNGTATWTLLGTVDDGSGTTSRIRGFETYAGSLLVFADFGVHQIVSNGNDTYQIFPLLDDAAQRNNKNGLARANFGGLLFYNAGDGITRFDGNTRTEVGPNRSPVSGDKYQPLFPGHNGLPESMVATENFLYAAINPNLIPAVPGVDPQGSVMVYAGTGWNQFYKCAANDVVRWVFFTPVLADSGVLSNRILWLYDGRIRYIVLPAWGENPVLGAVSPPFTLQTGSLVTGWTSRGLPALTKVEHELILRADGLQDSADIEDQFILMIGGTDPGAFFNSVDVYFQIEEGLDSFNTDDWTYLCTFTDNPVETIRLTEQVEKHSTPGTSGAVGGLSYTRIRYLLVLSFSDSNTLPVIRSFGQRFAPRTQPRYGFTMVANAFHELARLDGGMEIDNGDILRTSLYALQLQPGPHYLDDGTLIGVVNHVENSSFEEDSNSDGLSDNWDEVEATVTTTRSSKHKVSGNYAQKVVIPVGVTDVAGISQGIQIPAGVSGLFGVSVFVEAGLGVVLQIVDSSSGDVLGQSAPAWAGTHFRNFTQFDQLLVELGPQAAHTSALFRVVIPAEGAFDGSVGGGTYYVDAAFAYYGDPLPRYYIDGSLARCQWTEPAVVDAAVAGILPHVSPSLQRSSYACYLTGMNEVFRHRKDPDKLDSQITVFLREASG